MQSISFYHLRDSPEIVVLTVAQLELPRELLVLVVFRNQSKQERWIFPLFLRQLYLHHVELLRIQNEIQIALCGTVDFPSMHHFNVFVAFDVSLDVRRWVFVIAWVLNTNSIEERYIHYTVFSFVLGVLAIQYLLAYRKVIENSLKSEEGRFICWFNSYQSLPPNISNKCFPSNQFRD